MKNILLIQLNSVRNFILSLPVVKVLREVYPEAEISYLVADNYQSLAADNIYLDRVITVDRTRFQRLKEDDGLWAAVSSLRPAVSRLRETKFDLIVDLQNDWKSNLLAYLASARKRITVQKKLGAVFYSAYVEGGCGRHLADDYLAALTTLDINPDNYRQDFGLTGGSQPRQKYITSLLEKHGISKADTLIAINPLSGEEIGWPVDKFIELGSWLTNELSARVVIVGKGLPEKEVERITSKTSGRVLNLTGQLNWSELAELLRRTDLLVAGSNPCLHLSQAVGTPALALFSDNDSGRVGPYGGKNMIVKSPDGAIENISVEAVINNLTTVLNW